MGRKADEGPSDLELALGGDEDALESVLGGLVAPLFDLALHLADEHPGPAEEATVLALRELVRAVRSGSLPHPEPLMVAARHLVQSVDDRRITPHGGGAFLAAVSKLQPGSRRALLVAYALDADPAELAYVLDLSVPDAASDKSHALKLLELSDERIVESLDALAAEVPLPRGLIDRALAD